MPINLELTEDTVCHFTIKDNQPSSSGTNFPLCQSANDFFFLLLFKLLFGYTDGLPVKQGTGLHDE